MCAVLVAVVMCAVTPLTGADPEPRYKGKPLAYWVERLQKAPTDEEQKAVAEAVAAFGRDAAPAVPELLAMLQDHSWEYRELIVNILCEIGPGAKDAVPVLVRRLKEKKARDPEHVIRILGAIGPDAKDAVPALIAALDDPELRTFAAIALCKMGPAAKDALPGIRRVALEIVADEEAGKGSVALSFRKGQHRWTECEPADALRALRALGKEAVPILVAMLDAPGKRGKEYALREFEELGPAGAKGVPVLKMLLTHNEPKVRYLACVALWSIEKNVEVVPVLTDLLQGYCTFGSDNFHSQIEPARLLGEIGPAAKDALPVLRAILNPSGVALNGGAHDRQFPDYVREAAQAAIAKIEQKPPK